MTFLVKVTTKGEGVKNTQKITMWLMDDPQYSLKVYAVGGDQNFLKLCLRGFFSAHHITIGK